MSFEFDLQYMTCDLGHYAIAGNRNGRPHFRVIGPEVAVLFSNIDGSLIAHGRPDEVTHTRDELVEAAPENARYLILLIGDNWDASDLNSFMNEPEASRNWLLRPIAA